MSSLQDISSQLLLEPTTEDSLEAKEKVHVIGNKLCLLLRQVAGDLLVLQDRLVRLPRNTSISFVVKSGVLLHGYEHTGSTETFVWSRDLTGVLNVCFLFVCLRNPVRQVQRWTVWA